MSGKEKLYKGVKMYMSKSELPAPKVTKTPEQWKKVLGNDSQKYAITREASTERSFTGKYYHNKETGTYNCSCCSNELFKSKDKYDSGSGWPSFLRPIKNDAVLFIQDSTHGMTRVEVVCGDCHAHLGHVFEDAPEKDALRYCINSASLGFEKE